MFYINAKKLIELCLENNIFNLHEGRILLYRGATNNSKEGWYATDIEDVIHIVKEDVNGQQHLIDALKNKGVNFIPSVSETK